MGELVRALVLAGLLSGTQPITIMGLLLVMTGDRSTRNGISFISGAFVVETTILIAASLLVGGGVEPSSQPGRIMLVIRMALGAALVVVGVLLRRPPKKPAPEVPAALERLHSLSPGKAFVAGMVLADYQGPIVGSLAIASATVELSSRLPALLLYTLLASGIPVAVIIITTRSATAGQKLSNGTTWVMQNRRMLASIFAIVMGLFLVGDAALGLAVL